MPKASKASATQSQKLEGYEGHYEELGRLHGRVRELHGRRRPDAAVRRAARRPLPVPALGVRHQGQGHVQVRRPRGDLRDRRRVLRAVGPHAGPLRRHGDRGVQPHGGSRQDDGSRHAERRGHAGSDGLSDFEAGLSRWQALGNVYVVAEKPGLTPERARELAAGTDGVVEVLAIGDDWLEVRSGTRTARGRRCPATRPASPPAGCPREPAPRPSPCASAPAAVQARMLAGDDVEQDLGEVEWRSPRQIDGIHVTPVYVGNPHAVVDRRPERSARASGRASRRTRASRSAPTFRSHGSTHRAGRRRGSGSEAWGRRPRRERAPSRWPQPPTGRARWSSASPAAH